MAIPQSIRFWACIVGGLVFFSIVSSVIWRSVCSDSNYRYQPTQSSSEDNNGTSNLRHLIDETTWHALKITKDNQKDAANHPAKASNTTPNPRLLTVVCDAKITDFALVFFTYCLVVVGWFTMKSNVQTLQDMSDLMSFWQLRSDIRGFQMPSPILAILWKSISLLRTTGKLSQSCLKSKRRSGQLQICLPLSENWL